MKKLLTMTGFRHRLMAFRHLRMGFRNHLMAFRHLQKTFHHQPIAIRHQLMAFRHLAMGFRRHPSEAAAFGRTRATRHSKVANNSYLQKLSFERLIANRSQQGRPMTTQHETEKVSRRSLIAGIAAAGGTAAFAGVAAAQSMPRHDMAAMQDDAPSAVNPYSAPSIHEGGHGQMITVGRVDAAANGFDPTAMLTDWDFGTVSLMEDGRVLRTFEVEAIDKYIEIAPGVTFPAWTFNGRVPGPALRAKEGERLRIVFRNYGSHPHSMHFHGIHSWRMDGVPGAGLINPGEEFIYEFDARPFGCHLYHCHALPLKRHMHKGMYGAFVIDPDPELHPEFADAARSRLYGTPENARWQELVMVMNAFDTNFDNANEFYAVNTVAHAFAQQPIRIEKSRPVRIYLVNVTEFDPINSFHLHANFFDYFDTGTTLTPTLRTVDLIMQCQAQRGILEFSYAEHEAGPYMFHAHQAEFTELGWMGMFDVVEA